ncbi:MAG: alpha/beta hydrolase family protein, partial [Rhabdochlamydiaceae bacterium]
MKEAILHEKIGVQALDNGFRKTAADAIWRASMYNHFGQFMEYHNLAVKHEAVKRKTEEYRKCAPLFDPPAERVEIPFENVIMPAYFRSPKGVG